MTKDEALDLALEIMRNQGDVGVDEWMAAEAAIKQARSAPVQEPVAILNHAHGVYVFRSVNLQGLPDGEYQVYTTPPAAQRQWVGLNEDQRQQVRNICDSDIPAHIFHAIEAKLKERNT